MRISDWSSDVCSSDLALGLCEDGESASFLTSGQSTFGDAVVVNPSGGLLSKVHPVGCSGVAQVVVLYWQLPGQAGARPVPNARLGMTHGPAGGLDLIHTGPCPISILTEPATVRAS